MATTMQNALNAAGVVPTPSSPINGQYLVDSLKNGEPAKAMVFTLDTNAPMRITWVDGKTYSLTSDKDWMAFLRNKLHLEWQDIDADRKAKKSWLDIFREAVAENNLVLSQEGEPAVEAFSGTANSLQAEIDRLNAENAALRAKAAGGRAMSLKVSEKGALSVYGLGRFPVSLYREQWEALLAHADQIKAFIRANTATLTTKQR